MPAPIRAHDFPSMSAALEGLEREVRLLVFARNGQRLSDEACAIAAEVAAAGAPLVDIEHHEVPEDRAIARRLGIWRTPCVAVLGADGDTGIRFYGSLEGAGAASLVAAVRLVGGADPGLSTSLRARLGELVDPVKLRLFTMPSIEGGSLAVRTAAAAALACPALWLDVLDASEVPTLAWAYGVTRIPAVAFGGSVIAASADEARFVADVVRASCTPLDPDAEAA